MRVSAVGFLFQEKVQGKGLRHPVNYVCTIHKVDEDGNINRNYISSPVIKVLFTYFFATPLFLAASATALATAGPTRSSNAAGRMYSALSSSSEMSPEIA